MLRASRFTRWPSTVISPASYDSRPFTQRSSVDLPEPEGPITQTTSPWLTSSEIPSSTRLLPNDLRTLWIGSNIVLDGISLEVSQDRKSTRLNSSHQIISYAVFCLKKKNIHVVIESIL